MVVRGYTLIELMIAVAIIGIAVNIYLVRIDAYEASTRRSIHREALARVLDIEMAYLFQCLDRACVHDREKAPASPESDTWVRAEVVRHVEPGPDGTLRVTIEASSPEVKTQKISALLWVEP